MRVAIYVHGHPDVRPGGSEIAAYSLFQGLKKEVDDCLFLGALHGQAQADAYEIQSFSADGKEFVLPDLVADRFYQSSGRQRAFNGIARLLREKNVDVVHFHHFLGVGVDGVLSLRRLLPDVRFVFTAHEYLSICARDGQLLMPKRLTNKRCSAPAPGRCSICIPEHAPAEFEVRTALFQGMFNCFDAVISPSLFLATTLQPHVKGRAIEVIGNCTAQSERFTDCPQPASRDASTFAFFGQITPFKGLDIYLSAVDRFLERNKNGLARFRVYGGLNAAATDFNAEMAIRLKSGTVEHMGHYDSRSVVDLMSEVDWVVVPSIWWENSPVVIEEALCAGRPIICSDIGGMAEKVENGVSGLHFRAGSSLDLCRAFETCGGSLELWHRIVKTRRRPELAQSIIRKHIDIYERVLSKGATA